MVKLWISDKLDLRHSPEVWPKEPLPGIPSEMTFYHQQLAKAKEESLVIEMDPGSYNAFKAVHEAMGEFKPDSFIELPIEVELCVGGLGVVTLSGKQDGKHSVWVEWAGGRTNVIRDQIFARLKPQNSGHGYSEGAELAQELSKKSSMLVLANKNTARRGERIKELEAQLDAANARIKELENEDVDGFEKYQEAIITIGNLNKKIAELEAENKRLWNILHDTEVNGVADDEGGDGRMPFREGDSWNPVIDVDGGFIIDWPTGVSADIHYKVCDQFSCWMKDASNREIINIDEEYVPDFMCPKEEGFGDYIIMEVDETGKIKDWKFDQDKFVKLVEARSE